MKILKFVKELYKLFLFHHWILNVVAIQLSFALVLPKELT
jgi:hypothetical protein